MKRFYWPCPYAYRLPTFIMMSPKTKKWRPPTLCHKVNSICEITMKQDKICIIIHEIFRKIIINMCITNSILLLVIIWFYEFATNRNLTCSELICKAFQLGHPSIKDAMSQVKVNLAHLFLTKRWKCIKYYRQTKAHSSFQPRWAKKLHLAP